jgi:hypothetical protein
MIEHIPHQNTRRIPSQLGASRMSVWRALNFEGLYPYHIHSSQHLEPRDCDVRLHYYKWIDAYPEQTFCMTPILVAGLVQADQLLGHQNLPILILSIFIFGVM